MRKLIMGAVAAFSLLGAAGAQAAAPLIVAADRPGDVRLETVQYFYGGANYCWYDGGWHGPGFYWCGYAWRRGLGWGGPAGWRGWAYGPGYWRRGAWVGPRGYHHPEWGGWHGAPHGHERR